MAQKFPRDRFDAIPRGVERVGAHRAPARRGARWIAFGWAAGATVVLAVAGIVAVMVFNDRLDIGEPVASAAPTPTATVPPTLAPDIPVVVLNGTGVSGLAAGAQETLTAGGLQVSSTANASENDIADTIVYFTAPELEGAARGVASLLPEADVRFSEEFAQTGAQLVAVLGTDYATAVGG